MKLSDRTIISQQLEVISDAALIQLGRAADLIWIALKGRDGKDYALHLQSFFRICNDESVLITDKDKFYPSNLTAANSSFESDSWSWDTTGANRFDEWASDFNGRLSDGVVVEEISVHVWGDLEIRFSHDLVLTVYLDSTSSDEQWRFFELHSDKQHLVIFGTGVEDDDPYRSMR